MIEIPLGQWPTGLFAVLVGMPPIDDEEEDPFADVNVTATIATGHQLGLRSCTWHPTGGLCIVDFTGKVHFRYLGLSGELSSHEKSTYEYFFGWRCCGVIHQTRFFL